MTGTSTATTAKTTTTPRCPHVRTDIRLAAGGGRLATGAVHASELADSSLFSCRCHDDCPLTAATSAAEHVVRGWSQHARDPPAHAPSRNIGARPARDVQDGAESLPTSSQTSRAAPARSRGDAGRVVDDSDSRAVHRPRVGKTAPVAIVVLGDSLTFHGPTRGEPLDDPRLWPNLMAAELGLEVEVFARQGWTARDSWWSLTRDPRVWAQLPHADAVLLATGGMDKLPTSLPTYVRGGMSHLPTERTRDWARRGYLAFNPTVVRWTGGPFRTLGLRQTDAYHSRVVQALRQVRPELPIAGVVAHEWCSTYYPSNRTHAAAVGAARAWGAREGIPMADWLTAVHPLVPHGLNPDGMHFGWAAHRVVARATAEVLRPLLG
jgi:lysophospholipase L1-like esterase